MRIMITKDGVDRIVATVAGISSAVVPVLINEHVISSHTGETIGAVVAAIIASYHGSAVVTKKSVENTTGQDETLTEFMERNKGK